jgi:hypothetical protein
MPIERRLGGVAWLLAAGLSLLGSGFAHANDESPPRFVFDGPAQTVFTPAHGCDGNDVPDVNARAFRNDRGDTVLFALHDLNRPLTGPDLNHLSIDCQSAYAAKGDSDPAHYDDHAWIAAVWTQDGRHVAALGHEEYHANEHPGRCRGANAMACWYNTIIELKSDDGGRNFVKPRAPVVAAAPFRQDVDQTRHRGFFNPSNIIRFGDDWYMFASTTGWAGQPYGACLFRTATPEDPTSWRAYDGSRFSIAYADPYASPSAPPRPCAIIAPFRVPVGAVVRARGAERFLAVWQAKKDDGAFPVSGFYQASSADLLHWSAPRLLLAGETLYDDPCSAPGELVNYPSVLASDSRSRDYEDVGAHAWLYYAALRTKGCEVTSERVLLRRPLRIEGDDTLEDVAP